ncbi:response regulator transcription factor [Actinoplanes couchii]|uniref:DNA-binding response regulator n=1 Tax=Actinoplanes couchii TaxID=403638 RepID=A0ABQ3XNV0_9ACTN|nr:response regulator transcription factor [Actinoplanes couchii]MDR6319704.1 DNA-binding response OmpR family regulator [Actinoplanes couchii]GID60075.1 DNA-binding response regulator [Actinoplanes couchii]
MRILLVEDERDLAASLRAGLQRESYAVDVAHDGRDGWTMAQLHRYHLFVLDLMLPGLNGFQLCARIREAGLTAPILVLTAKDGEYDEAEALDTGADDYLTKPFSHVVLLARLRALLRRRPGPASSELRVGDLVLDPARRRCLRGSTEIPLTEKQFAVLATLARRAGEVVSKTEIIDEVWDMAFDGDINIIEVYVSALRRRVDLPFRRRSIQTVRGAGYRLVDVDE